MTKDTVKVIIDTDVDFDDLAAIVWLATQKEMSIIGLSTVGSGWTHIQCGTQILLDFMQFTGVDKIPIYCGEALPLIENRHIPEAQRFEVDTLWGIPLNKSENKIEGNAIDFIIDSCHQYAGQVVILAIGPLTNIAKAVLKDPEIAKKINKIIIMGGVPVDSSVYNHFPGNARLDLRATKIVYGLETPLYAVPPRLAHHLPVDEPLASALSSLHTNPTACFLGEMIKRILNSFKRKQISKQLFYWDVVAAMALKEFHHISAEKVHVTVNEDAERECDTIVYDLNGSEINVVKDLNMGDITNRFVARLRTL